MVATRVRFLFLFDHPVAESGQENISRRGGNLHCFVVNNLVRRHGIEECLLEVNGVEVDSCFLELHELGAPFTCPAVEQIRVIIHVSETVSEGQVGIELSRQEKVGTFNTEAFVHELEEDRIRDLFHPFELGIGGYPSVDGFLAHDRVWPQPAEGRFLQELFPDERSHLSREAAREWSKRRIVGFHLVAQSDVLATPILVGNSVNARRKESAC